MALSSSPNPSPAAAPKTEARSFPDPSLTLVEFSGEGLGLLLTAITERDVANRRIVLKKVAYVRLEPKDWVFVALPEFCIQQNPDGVFVAVEAKSGKIFRHPSRRHYELAFLSKELFECCIQCLKDREAGPLFELAAVSLGSKPGFSVESGFLVAPDDYASETTYGQDDNWLAVPPRLKQGNGQANGG
jgi:hypothetical protein